MKPFPTCSKLPLPPCPPLLHPPASRDFAAPSSLPVWLGVLFSLCVCPGNSSGVKRDLGSYAMAGSADHWGTNVVSPRDLQPPGPMTASNRCVNPGGLHWAQAAWPPERALEHQGHLPRKSYSTPNRVGPHPWPEGV